MNCTGYKPVDEMVGWHHWFNGHELGQTGRQWGARKPGARQSMALWRVGLDLANEQAASIWRKSHSFRFKRLHLKHKQKNAGKDLRAEIVHTRLSIIVISRWQDLKTYFLSALPEFSIFSIAIMHSFFSKKIWQLNAVSNPRPDPVLK